MEAKKGNRYVNMTSFLLFSLVFSTVTARIHHLNLEDDNRKQIAVSTFGFLVKGTLAVNITSFKIPANSKKLNNATMFGFTLDRSKSSGMPYMEEMEGRNQCILHNAGKKEENDTLDSVFFIFDFKRNRVNITRRGTNLENLLVTDTERDRFLISQRLHHGKRSSQGPDHLSDDSLIGSRRSVSGSRRIVREATKPKEQVTESLKTQAPPVVQKTTIQPPRKTEAPLTSEKGKDQEKTGENKESEETDTNPATAASPSALPTTAAGVNVTADGTQSAQSPTKDAENYDPQQLLTSVALNTQADGDYQTYFLVFIDSPKEEGLYNLIFHNCLAYMVNEDAAIDMTMDITEDNNGNFLSAGEMPVPNLYFTFCVLFFLAGVAWLSVLRKSNETVFKIHYLMLVVVFVKSSACLCHGVSMYFIQVKGIHEEASAILWYILYLARGALMLVTVLLIGSGWAFIKHVLSDKEKKLFIIIIPLQMLNGVAEVIVEESEEGNISYSTWQEIFILVDLLCCGAILFPVVWSIRHLQEASRTDGKAAINLQKLKLFRHFYILVVCYIYFTRIIVYLMKITLPFKLEWLSDLFTELAMLVFFVVTGIKFRPASDNPYLQVPQDSDDEIEMEEVLTKTGDMTTLVRVNQKTAPATEGATNQIKQRESSHDYD